MRRQVVLDDVPFDSEHHVPNVALAQLGDPIDQLGRGPEATPSCPGLASAGYPIAPSVRIEVEPFGVSRRCW